MAMSAKKGNPMVQFKWLILGMLLLVLSACTNSKTIAPTIPPELATATAIPNTPEPSNTPIQSTIAATSTPKTPQIVEKTPSPITHSPGPKNIVTSEIYDIWWSLDSKTLFYRIPDEGKFSYNLENGVIQKLSTAEVLQQTLTPDILAQLPPYYREPHISPSGNKAIYIKQADTPPLVTIDPSVEGGEALIDGHQFRLWLWEDNTSQLLGNPLQCRFDESFWTPDEKQVVLVEASIPMISCPVEAQAWLFNLEDGTYTPLFPPSDYFNLRVFGFSPNGEQLLVGFFSDFTGANLHFLDINTLDLTSIDVPVHSFIQWIDEENILVEYRGDLPSAPYPVGILNLKTLEFTELFPMFSDKYVKNVLLSPDHKWIAFSTGGGHFAQYKVWLMQFELPQPWWKVPN